MSTPKDAQKRWELENAIKSDEIYNYNKQKHDGLANERPWKKDPNYFKHVKISAVALLKMVMHARSGKELEVMGLMQGYIEEHTMIITDAFALPVEGTETRVNAQQEAYEYMVEYLELIKSTGRKENAIGWYHSHPGYGCWLSGIDVSTQMLNQQYQEPWLAVVIDPTRTISAGKVEIGAFRTYPEGHKAADEGPQQYQSIPLSKIEDFGVHAKQYYPLDISYFKSSTDSHMLDLLWNKYWVNTLAQNPLVQNRAYTTGAIRDLADKLDSAEAALNHSGRMGGYWMPEKRKEESQLSKVSTDAARVTSECVHGLISQVLKDYLFNQRSTSEYKPPVPKAPPSGPQAPPPPAAAPTPGSPATK